MKNRRSPSLLVVRCPPGRECPTLLVRLANRAGGHQAAGRSRPTLPHPEGRLPVPEGVRPVGYVTGHLVLVGVRELREQGVTPLLTVEKAQASQVPAAGRGRRVLVPVPDDVPPGLPQEADRLQDQGPRYVPAPRERGEVEYVAVYAVGYLQHGVTQKILPALHADDGHRGLGGTGPVAPAQEGRVPLDRAGHRLSDPLEQPVERTVELSQQLHFRGRPEGAAQHPVDSPQAAV